MMRFLLILLFLVPSFLISGQIQIESNHYAVTHYATSSVLSSGKWFKIKILHDGIYKLTYEDIAGMGFSDPANVRIFGNGGSMQPLMNGAPRYDDLIENAVYMYKGNDGVFNQGDYILFYGHGPVTWNYNPSTLMFEHTLHAYSQAAYYFVTTEAGTGKKIGLKQPVTGNATLQVTDFDDYSYHEKNRINFLKSGRQWFGEKIDYSPFDTVFKFKQLVTSVPVKIKVNVAGRSESVRYFTLTCNNQLVSSIDIPTVILKNKTGTYANQKTRVFTFTATGDDIPVELSYNKVVGDDEGYLDYITINARRRLYLTDNLLFFRDQSVAQTNQIASYTLQNANDQTVIWDITNPFDITQIPGTLSGDSFIFKDSTSTLKQYVALKPGLITEKPVITANTTDVGPVVNQDLHGTAVPQLLIITNPLFKEAADSLAEFHRQNDHMNVAVVTTLQVYNEFSSGAPDVSAVRDFARLLYKKSTDPEDRLEYLLFVGDGSYNNLSQATGNANFILTYQSDNSLNASYSYVSDDFFGILDDNEGGSENMENYSLDLGLGRLPVKTAKEAMAVFHKIKHYNSSKTKGDWQNNILFAADDEDGNMHMKQADQIATWFDTNYPQFAIKKVFIDEYPQIVSTLGARYPDANRIICNNIEKGLLIFNYTGHGGEIGLADEQILMREDLENLRNFDHLPLFVTATCEFSRFDDLTRDDDGTITENTSAGEYSILNADGGSIGLLTTTRIVYSTENHELNTLFYQVALSRDDNGNYRNLGDMIRMTKNAVGSSRNKLNFILLGDPAMKLALPEYNVVTDSVNDVPAWMPVDTLKAFSKIEITGHIADNHNNIINSYNGLIYPSVFDKKKTITTLANDGEAVPMQFSSMEDLLYKGKASVVDGKFRFEFIVPKDITYSYGNGRINYYACNAQYDANGQFSNFLIGGSDNSIFKDNQGPDILLYMNDENFISKGVTGPDPVIYAKISDESGINTTGNGIGHDITGIIDDNDAYPVVMNDYFETDLDNYNSGILTYPMSGLSDGLHTLRVKVWDTYNNSSEQTLVFRVVNDDHLFINHAVNFPNPATDHTTFEFEHNMAKSDLEVTVSIFDMSGRLVTSFSQNVTPSGYNTALNVWDLRDSNGNRLSSGVYPYRIKIADETGKFAECYQKLTVIRQ